MLAKEPTRFVGSTGVHMNSPEKPPFTYLGETMHWLFWEEIATPLTPPAIS